MEAVHNVLVISDLHLGEDLGNASEHRKAHVQQTDDALQAFFAHYCLMRHGDRPWKLVINGDMIDFLSVHLVPDDVGVEGNETDTLYGFGATESVAVHKLRRVIERHTGFFDGLARFLDAGNEVHIVTGNHDAEFHFEQVRLTFREAMGLRTSIPSPKLYFHPWFFLEPGFAYLEHGHQYDPFCSFDDPLTPEDLDDPTVLEENLGTAAMRYLGNHLPVDPDATADLSFVEYLRLISNSQAEVTNRFVGGYAAVVRVLMVQWWTRLRHPTAWLKRQEARKKRLAELSVMTGLDRKLLNRLQKLRRPPVFAGLLQLVRSVMLGRLLSAALLPPMLFAAFWLGFLLVSLQGALVAVLFVLIAFVVLQLWLALGRDSIDPTESMGRTAARISRLVGAPVVVFGHSHVPLARHLGKRSWYFNTGSWAGGADRSGAFTHLVVTRVGSHVRAALCRWQGEESRELRVETTSTPQRPEQVGMSTGY